MCLKLQALKAFGLLSAHCWGQSAQCCLAPSFAWACAKKPKGLCLGQYKQERARTTLQKPSFLHLHHLLHRILSPLSRKLGVEAEP